MLLAIRCVFQSRLSVLYCCLSLCVGLQAFLIFLALLLWAVKKANVPAIKRIYNAAKVAAVNGVNSVFGIFTTVLPPPCIFLPPAIGTHEAY